MACILKIPGKSKGVVTFTTFEYLNVIDEDSFDTLSEIKDDWVVGLHYNWPTVEPKEVFDFAMAGADWIDEAEVGRLIPLTAGNFVPPYFRPDSRDKHWDVLYVSRAVKRKNVEFFMKSIKRIYNQGRTPRVLLLITVPEDKRERVPRDLNDVYTQVFTPQERKFFNLIKLDYDLPFPLDLETLSVFYRNSKAFVHPSPSEGGRVRTAGYAWACEMPVIGMNLYHPDLERNGLKKKPYYYQADEWEDFPELIWEAIDDYGKSKLSHVRELFAADHTRLELKELLEQMIQDDYQDQAAGAFFLVNLDRRLARHHGAGANDNRIDMDVNDFITHLREPSELMGAVWSNDPERDIWERFSNRTISKPSSEAEDIELPTPASELPTRRSQLLQKVRLYRPAKYVYDRIYGR